MPEPILTTAASAASAGAKVIQIAQQQGWLRKLIDAFKEKRPVLVLGSTGVGKSNFLLSLKQLVPVAIDSMNRTELARHEKIKIDREIFVFLDTPGQKLHAARRADAILESAGTPHLGIINVVSWGYHENRTGGSAAITDGKPSSEYLSEHRDREIEYLKEWAPFIGSRAAWVFTLVTKADLWWNDRDKVIKHYEEGEYAEYLRDAGVRNHSVFAYCSVRHHFYGYHIDGGLDDGTKVELQQQVLREMLKAVAYDER